MVTLGPDVGGRVIISSRAEEGREDRVERVVQAAGGRWWCRRCRAGRSRDRAGAAPGVGPRLGGESRALARGQSKAGRRDGARGRGERSLLTKRPGRRRRQ